MTNIIERMAIAIFDSICTREVPIPWSAASPAEQATYLRAARAVVDAMGPAAPAEKAA